MNVRLGPSGRWLVVGGLSILGAGLAAGLPVVTALGGLVLLGLAPAVARARLLSRDLQRGGLTVRTSGIEGRVRVHRPLTMDLAVEGPLADLLDERTLEPGAVAPLKARIERTEDGSDRLVLTSPRVGHAWLQGFFVTSPVAGGLLTLRGWVAHPIRVSVVPETFPLRDEGSLHATRTSLQDRSGTGRARRRGFGMEIRELRDHQPGDPFKHIAWGASARRGKLVSREFESDRRLSAWLLLDVSPSMYWGPPGATRIDFAVETAWNLAQLLLARGDRAGLMLYDAGVRLSLTPTARRGQRFRILEALQEVHHLVHEDRTEITDRELVQAVAAWFEAQQQRSFRLPERLVRHRGPRQPEFDEAHLFAAADAHLAAVRAGRRATRFPVPTTDYARDPRQATWRAFCRQVGIPLPLDPTPRPGGQALGMEHAVERVLRSRGGPHTLVVISDLSTADEVEALRRAALGARRHRHTVVVLCPTDPAFEAPSGEQTGPLDAALVEVERLRTRHGLEAVTAALRPAGVTVVPCGPTDALPRLLSRLEQVA